MGHHLVCIGRDHVPWSCLDKLWHTAGDGGWGTATCCTSGMGKAQRPQQHPNDETRWHPCKSLSVSWCWCCRLRGGCPAFCAAKVQIFDQKECSWQTWPLPEDSFTRYPCRLHTIVDASLSSGLKGVSWPQNGEGGIRRRLLRVLCGPFDDAYRRLQALA